MNCIKVKRNNLLNRIYSSVSSDFRFKEAPYVNFFTDPELHVEFTVLFCIYLFHLSQPMRVYPFEHIQELKKFMNMYTTS